MHEIDLRSDTTTRPTEEMRRAMYDAEVGDEGYADDPTVRKLEELAAQKVGKEASVFCVSGTMANLIGVMCHTIHGDEVICESESHLYWYENAGLALLPSVQPVLIRGDRFRVLDPAAVKAALKPVSSGPSRRLLCLENTHNRAGGTVTTAERMSELYNVAHSAGLPVHLDGARLFNAATYLGVPATEIAKSCDSLMFCLSKGLGAPMGSMLCGSKEFIDKARKFRKAIGGGLRQVGVVAAAGLVGLTKMVDRLGEDHKNARLLAEGLAEIPGINIDLDSVQTNIVAYDVSGTGMDAPTLVQKLAARGVKCTSHTSVRIRMVTHKDVSECDIKQALATIRTIAAENKKSC
jgi:threonine aldolase